MSRYKRKLQNYTNNKRGRMITRKTERFKARAEKERKEFYNDYRTVSKIG